MPVSARPPSIAADWLLPGRGFAYSSPPSVVTSSPSQGDADEWMRLLMSLERLKRGEHDDASLVALLRESESAEIRESALRILGHAGGRESRLAIADFFSDPDVDTRSAAYEAAVFACDLALVDPLMRARRTAQPQERLHIMSAISHLLEHEPAALYDDLGELSNDVYEAYAYERVAALQREHGDGTAIFEGSVLNLAYVLERIDTLCDSPDATELGGSLSRYVEMFEGTTGTPSVDTFDDELTPNCPRIREMRAEFERTGTASRFRPGQRYFFGHALPS